MSNLHSNKNQIRILKGFLNKDSVIPSRHQEWFFTEINPYIILALIITEGDSIYNLYELYCKYKNKSSKKKQDHTEAFIYTITELPYAIFNKITIEKLNKGIQTLYSRWKKKLADPNRSMNKDIHMMSEYHKLVYMKEALCFVKSLSPIKYNEMMKDNILSKRYKNYDDVIAKAQKMSSTEYFKVKESYKKHSNAVSAMTVARRKSISICNTDTGEVRHYFEYKDMTSEFNICNKQLRAFIAGKEVKKMKGWKIL